MLKALSWQLEPSPKVQMNVVITRSGNQVENSGEKSEEVKESKLIPYEKEAVEDEKKEEPYFNLPYKPPISFALRLVKAKIEAQFKKVHVVAEKTPHVYSLKNQSMMLSHVEFLRNPL